MEVSLVNNVSLTFKNDSGTGGDKFCSLQNANWTSSLKLVSVTGSHTNQKLQNKLNSLLNVGPTGDTAILCSMRIGKEMDVTEDQLQIKWATRGIGSFFRRLSPAVRKATGLQMRMEIGDHFQNVSHVYPLRNLVEGEVVSSLVMNIGAAPADLVKDWKLQQNGQIGTLSGRLSINLIFEDEAFLSAHFFENKPENHCGLILSKMLETAENNGDTVITSVGGATVKCHKTVLVAGSPYFQAMFQSGMWESTTNQVNMTDMTEVEVRAFLSYLYVGDVKSALENIQTGFMLLKAGYYYQLDELVSGMREILMMRGNDKYSVELALEMLLFAKNVSRIGVSGSQPQLGKDSQELLNGVWNDLSLKAVQVLKWYSKERPMELMASEKYKKLYVETPQLAMELHAKFLQYVDTEAIEKGVNNGEPNLML